MPVIARFYGITLRMYFRQSEHNPPHIHAVCGEYIGLFSIEGAEMFEGNLPIKEQELVCTFIRSYKAELMRVWKTQEFAKIDAVI